jgi:hypothetical protein
MFSPGAVIWFDNENGFEILLNTTLAAICHQLYIMLDTVEVDGLTLRMLLMGHVIYKRGNNFEGRRDIESFEVADDVDEIKESAFRGCINLKSLKGLSTSKVSKIERRAFQGCTSLTSLKGLPPTLVNIEVDAFDGCTGIASIGYGFNPDCNINVNAFYNCPQLYAAATANHHASIKEYGNAVWLLSCPRNLRWTVLQSVQTARRLIDNDNTYTCSPNDIHPLLRLLATVPSGDDNESTRAEDQVLRHIVSFVGVGFDVDT